MKALTALLVVALVCLAPAGAAGAPFSPDLADAVARLDRARGPEAFAALRKIWATWDRADPTHVEEALLAASRDGKLAPPARAYAALLVAYARARRGDVRAARDQIAALGFVDRWLVIGPFDNEGKAGFDAELGPEAALGEPIVLARAYGGKERPVRWRAVPAAFPFGFLDTSALVRPERKACVFAATFVRAKSGSRAPRTISAWIGASGAHRLYFNGQERLSDPAYRGHDADRRAAVLRLEPGYNQLVVELCGDESAPVLSLRLADANGAPARDLELSNDVAHSVEAAALAKKLGAERPPVAAKGPEGPLQVLERWTSAKQPSASDLFAHAEYLVSTDGDDPTVHAARDLARRAAEREPTVERLLLAGQLAEDRNQAAAWLDKAVELDARAPTRDIRVVLAEAALARQRPDWRAAFPLYQRALDLDPDNVVAIAGRVSLYNDAGLKRTALDVLTRALERNSSSVNLLNMYASQLRELGRATEADEAERRYFALRFDDHGFLGNMIDLAIARRDRPAAERWVERLLDADPDSQWSHGVAARAFRALGQPERAKASLRRALELAPEDVGTLRTLADLEGELGRREEQLALLRTILQIRPQEKDVREYVEHIQPPRPRPDEAYAWAAERFLKLRHAQPRGETRRTLRDLTVSTVYANGLSSKFRQVVFQPLTDAAAASARQYAFQYHADREIVQLRGARVYRGDGRVDEAIEYGEGPADNPAISMYTSGRTFYVQLPRLEPGDVVELRYRLDDVTPRNEFADYFGEVVYLQSDEPVQNAEYVVVTPKSRTLYVDEKLPGLKREVAERGDQRIYRFFAEKVAALSPEPSMPPWPEVLGFVHVSTYKTWKDLGRWYWGLVREQFDLDDETRKLARNITKGAKTDLDKVKAVYGWVVNNTRYVALEFGIYGYKPRRCVQTVARGWGDCKDKATVIVTLLEELGIPSTIVVLRTQLRGGFRSELPSLAPFDHAIVYVPSLNLWLDGTAEYTGTLELPKPDLGAMALLVNRGDSKLVTVPEADPEQNIVRRKVTAQLAPGGEAQIEIDYFTHGAAAPEWRRRYQAEATRVERVAADLGREFPGLALLPGPQGVRANDLDDLEQPVELHVRGLAPGFARREGQTLSMDLTPQVRLTPGYASLSRRTQDVKLLGFSTIDDTFVVKLPPGMKVVSAPPPARADGPFGAYAVEVEQQPGAVVVKTRLVVRASRITPDKYAAWKTFCGEVDRALSHPVVVSK